MWAEEGNIAFRLTYPLKWKLIYFPPIPMFDNGLSSMFNLLSVGYTKRFLQEPGLFLRFFIFPREKKDAN